MNPVSRAGGRSHDAVAEQGRGIARRMLEHLEGIARAEGLETVHLDATLNAAAFYRNCGYVGDALSTYQSPFGLELSCIPMRKAMARV
ncbi:GNAT family N-acetyltransferase [Pseudomonas sp. AA27]|uniref:GNAT family N-acetyltransferase n=1 Tax=Pseudomonas sp. AA27 TaxID=2908652 RepID=UPI0022795F19|nr:GNAT family N-acetyltransferase [Pseudomonas sp. AA27]